MTGPSWEFRKPEVIQYKNKPFLPGLDDDEVFDITGYTVPSWVVKFDVRKTFSLFGKRIWTGDWKPMQMHAS